jgi:hypothetical protein
MTTASGNMTFRDYASLSTLVTARFTCVPMTTDSQITTDEDTYCWIDCSVFGSREVIKGGWTTPRAEQEEEQFARRED